MKNAILILRRELGLSLRKPSFWLLALVVPLMLTILYALPLTSFLAQKPTTVLVVDETGLFAGAMPSDEAIHYRTLPTLDEAKRQMGGKDALLLIPRRQTTIPRDAFLYYQRRAPSLTVQSRIDSRLQTLLQNAIAEDVYGLDPDAYRSLEATHINLHTRQQGTTHDSHPATRRTLASVLAILMALTLTVFGIEVMKSVRQERHSRIAELLLTSVHPLGLMWGKVGAVAIRATLQVALWIGLTTAAIATIRASLRQPTPDLLPPTADLIGLSAIDLPLTAAIFLLFFLLGLALYGLVLAAIGSRLDADADATGWSIAACSPLLIAGLATPLVGAHATPFILCPLTAPVSVVATLPFGIDTWLVATAALLTLACAILAAFAAARTYRKHIVA